VISRRTIYDHPLILDALRECRAWQATEEKHGKFERFQLRKPRHPVRTVNMRSRKFLGI
jgi:hypothetical protein